MSDASRLDEEETEMVDDPSAVAVNVEPAKVVEAPEADPVAESIAEVEAESAPVEKKSSFMDDLLADMSNDPFKKDLITKAVQAEAQRLKDEWAGREASWLPKDSRKEYVRNPEKWKQEQAKLAEFDKLHAEVDNLRKQSVSPSPTPEKAKAPEVADTKEVAKQFVERYNLNEEQTDMVAGLIEMIDKRVPAKTPQVDISVELAKLQWEKEKLEVEAEKDFRDNRTLRALAFEISRTEKLSPKDALASARQELGLNKPPATKVSGTPQKGKPAFARESRPTTDQIEYDGKTDPLQQLKKKYSNI